MGVKSKKELARYDKKHTLREPADFTEYVELPTWVRTAVAMVALGGYTQKEAAEKCGRAGGTLSGYMNTSPAVKIWVKQLQEASKDPKAMAEYTFKASAYGITLEYYAAYEKAIEASDFNAVAKMSQDMLDRAGVTKKKDVPDAGKIQVTLNIAGSGALDFPEVEASYEKVEVEDADFEIEE